MAERRNEVGPCGVHCAGCLDYRALATDDPEVRRRAAEAISRETGKDLRPGQVGCEGCWGGIHEAWCASPACEIRRCADGKGYATCAECSDFPCAAYLAQFGDGGEPAKKIEEIRTVGLAAWLEGRGQ